MREAFLSFLIKHRFIRKVGSNPRIRGGSETITSKQVSSMWEYSKVIQSWAKERFRVEGIAAFRVGSARFRFLEN